MRDIKWSVNGALNILLQPFSPTLIIVLDFKSLAFSHICGHFQVVLRKEGCVVGAAAGDGVADVVEAGLNRRRRFMYCDY